MPDGSAEAPTRPRHGYKRTAEALGLAIAAAFLAACPLSLDPDCYRPDHGPRIRQNGQLLLLTVARHGAPGTLALYEVDGAGGAAYRRDWGEMAYGCQHVSEETLGSLAELWSAPELSAIADADCRSGLSFRRLGDSYCSEAYRQRTQPDTAAFQQLRLSWNGAGGTFDLYWDLESALPEPLRSALAGTVTAACAESEAFRRRLHEQFATLAQEVGC